MIHHLELIGPGWLRTFITNKTSVCFLDTGLWLSFSFGPHRGKKKSSNILCHAFLQCFFSLFTFLLFMNVSIKYPHIHGPCWTRQSNSQLQYLCRNLARVSQQASLRGWVAKVWQPQQQTDFFLLDVLTITAGKAQLWLTPFPTARARALIFSIQANSLWGHLMELSCHGAK